MIFSWIILIILSILVLIWVYYSFKNDDETFGGSIAVLVLIIILGWIIFGGFNSVNYDISKIDNVEIIKSNYFIIVAVDGKFYVFEKKKDFNYIKDTTTFYYKNGINMYGGYSNTKELFYYSYQDTIIKIDTINIIYNKQENLGEKL